GDMGVPRRIYATLPLILYLFGINTRQHLSLRFIMSMLLDAGSIIKRRHGQGFNSQVVSFSAHLPHMSPSPHESSHMLIGRTPFPIQDHQIPLPSTTECPSRTPPSLSP